MDGSSPAHLVPREAVSVVTQSQQSGLFDSLAPGNFGIVLVTAHQQSKGQDWAVYSSSVTRSILYVSRHVEIYYYGVQRTEYLEMRSTECSHAL